MIQTGRLACDRFAHRSDWQAIADPRAAIAGLIALGLWLASPAMPASLMADLQSDERVAASSTGAGQSPARATGREYALGGYGGVSYTQPSAVHIDNPGVTDLTAANFGWIGRPFKSPIYYGLRAQRWTPGAMLGTMIDFTHAKAIAVTDDTATFSGTMTGQPLPSSARLDTVFRRLEFSHGHNMLTLNGLIRSPMSWLPVRPYFGLGGGISLPHTEIELQGQTRTYEYQFAGFVGQVLAGIEVPLGRTSIFFEYKFSYAPYSVPLTQEPTGHLLVTDVWRQFRSWLTGEKPPGGVLSTTLATHHGISGVLVRTAPVPQTVAKERP